MSRYRSLSDMPETHRAHITFNLQLADTECTQVQHEKKLREKEWGNWLTYSEPNSCWEWEWGAYLPTTASMSFSIRWKALSLSLFFFFFSISPGNLFRVGGKKTGAEPRQSVLAKYVESHSRLQPIRRSWQRQLRPSATTWLFTVCKKKKNLFGELITACPTNHTHKNIPFNCLHV